MHTPEQAQDLWCPMARVAQVGAVEAHTSYNRFLIKRHVSVGIVSKSDADELNIGNYSQQIKPATMVEAETDLSDAAMCVADRCAAWRQHDAEHGYCGLAGKPTN